MITFIDFMFNRGAWEFIGSLFLIMILELGVMGIYNTTLNFIYKMTHHKYIKQKEDLKEIKGEK